MTREEQCAALAYEAQEHADKLNNQIDDAPNVAMRILLEEAEEAMRRVSRAYIIIAERERHDV